MTIRFLPSIVVAPIICIPAYAVSANWTLLVYIQTDADLNAAVCKNLYYSPKTLASRSYPASAVGENGERVQGSRWKAVITH